MDYLKAQKTLREGLFDLERLNVHTHNGCNIKCLGCNHHSPDYSLKSTIDTTALIKDLTFFLGRCRVKKVHILGGEPLLNPQGTRDVAQFLLDNKMNTRLITNGLLLPKHISWVLELIESGLDLYVSIHNDQAANIVNKLKLEYSNFICNVNDFRSEYWFDLRGPFNSDPVQSFKKCISLCPQLYNGKVYKCPHSAYILDIIDKDDSAWNYMRNYKPLDIYASNEEYVQFFKRQYKPEKICEGCPDNPKLFLHQQRN